jgi:hypothetical protein
MIVDEALLSVVVVIQGVTLLAPTLEQKWKALRTRHVHDAIRKLEQAALLPVSDKMKSKVLGMYVLSIVSPGVHDQPSCSPGVDLVCHLRLCLPTCC